MNTDPLLKIARTQGETIVALAESQGAGPFVAGVNCSRRYTEFLFPIADNRVIECQRCQYDGEEPFWEVWEVGYENGRIQEFPHTDQGLEDLPTEAEVRDLVRRHDEEES